MTIFHPQVFNKLYLLSLGSMHIVQKDRRFMGLMIHISLQHFEMIYEFYNLKSVNKLTVTDSPPLKSQTHL